MNDNILYRLYDTWTMFQGMLKDITDWLFETRTMLNYEFTNMQWLVGAGVIVIIGWIVTSFLIPN